jgi:hypothetical protein
LTDEIRVANDGRNLVKLALHQSKLETVLGWIDGKVADFALTVQAENILALDIANINRLLESPDDAVITVD